MKMTIYEMIGEFERLSEDMEAADGSDDPEVYGAIFDRIAALDINLVEKMDGVVSVIRNLDAVAEAQRKEALRISQRAAVNERAASRLEGLATSLLDAAGQKGIETARFKVSVQSNGGNLPLIQDHTVAVETLPAHLKTTVISTTPAMYNIRDALTRGESVPGFTLGQRGRHLRVR